MAQQYNEGMDYGNDDAIIEWFKEKKHDITPDTGVKGDILIIIMRELKNLRDVDLEKQQDFHSSRKRYITRKTQVARERTQRSLR